MHDYQLGNVQPPCVFCIVEEMLFYLVKLIQACVRPQTTLFPSNILEWK